MAYFNLAPVDVGPGKPNKVKNMKMRGLITLLDYDEEEIRFLLDLAKQTKEDFKLTGPKQSLAGRTSVLIFEKPSLRTRVTFEVAMAHLGGTTLDLAPNQISLGQRESVKDAARSLSRWVDIIIARTFKHSLAVELARYANIPVVNALTDLFHPCQALAFGQTLLEHRGALEGAHVVFVGDGNNVANSLAVLCAKLGMDFTLACPPGYEQPAFLQDHLRPLFRAKKCSYRLSHDPQKAVAKADVLYTDTWVSMGEEHQADTKKRDFSRYQVNHKLLAQAAPGCLVSHCLPAHRGEEITNAIMESAACICFDEAENRLHVQKAVLLALLRNLLPPRRRGGTR